MRWFLLESENNKSAHDELGHLDRLIRRPDGETRNRSPRYEAHNFRLTKLLTSCDSM